MSTKNIIFLDKLGNYIKPATVSSIVFDETTNESVSYINQQVLSYIDILNSDVNTENSVRQIAYGAAEYFALAIADGVDKDHDTLKEIVTALQQEATARYNNDVTLDTKINNLSAKDISYTVGIDDSEDKSTNVADEISYIKDKIVEDEYATTVSLNVLNTKINDAYSYLINVIEEDELSLAYSLYDLNTKCTYSQTYIYDAYSYLINVINEDEYIVTNALQFVKSDVFNINSYLANAYSYSLTFATNSYKYAINNIDNLTSCKADLVDSVININQLPRTTKILDTWSVNISSEFNRSNPNKWVYYENNEPKTLPNNMGNGTLLANVDLSNGTQTANSCIFGIGKGTKYDKTNNIWLGEPYSVSESSVLTLYIQYNSFVDNKMTISLRALGWNGSSSLTDTNNSIIENISIPAPDKKLKIKITKNSISINGINCLSLDIESSATSTSVQKIKTMLISIFTNDISSLSSYSNYILCLEGNNSRSFIVDGVHYLDEHTAEYMETFKNLQWAQSFY